MRVVVMGVSGCGKTSVGSELAASLGYPFADADDFHSAANKAKMAAGTGLTDDDRWPWLDALGEWLAQRPDSVLACSALRRVYRDRLREHAGVVVFLHLTAGASVLRQRLDARTKSSDHFAGSSLLESQLATLEPLHFDEVGGSIDVGHASLRSVVSEAHDIIALQDD